MMVLKAIIVILDCCQLYYESVYMIIIIPLQLTKDIFTPKNQNS